MDNVQPFVTPCGVAGGNFFGGSGNSPGQLRPLKSPQSRGSNEVIASRLHPSGFHLRAGTFGRG
jgi:hypothetical protein